MGHFWKFLNYVYLVSGPTVMLLYPLYASIVAIESPSKTDDEQWLSYWILYSFITLTEMMLQPLLKWIPIWYPIKVAFATWLVLPQFMGASFLYERYVREQLTKYSGGVGSSSKGKNKSVRFETTKKGEQETH